MDIKDTIVEESKYSYTFYTSHSLTTDQIHRLNEYITDGLFEESYICDVPWLVSDVIESPLT